jgi:hypothetical protein
MRNSLSFLTAALTMSALALCGTSQAQDVELLISGNFEAPGGLDIPGWTLTEFITNDSGVIDSAELTGGADGQIFLKAFAGGGPLDPPQGNFDNDGLPAGDVDGADFLTWQRNLGLMGTATREQGDATGDMNVNGDDLNIWKSNFGTRESKLTNARFQQTVPAAPGQTYNLVGTSLFEENYSGFVTTLGDRSPLGQIPSPTTTQFKLEFLNNGALIGSPTILDLRTEQTFPGFPITHTPLMATAPAGTTDVRVTAEALNMAWNGTAASNGEQQSAFFDDFTLTTTANPGTELLTNGGLNLDTPDALDFWNQIEGPQDFTPFDQILRAGPGQTFSNHTPGGTRGVWLSAFFGFADPDGPGVWSTDEGVDGIISQTVEAVAGGSYNFSGWTKFETNYSGGVDTITGTNPPALISGQQSPTRTEIVLEFFDVDGVTDPNGPLQSFVIDTEASRKMQEDLADDGILNGTGIANDGQWRQHSLMAIAPAGTRFARLTAQMLDGVYNFGGQQSAFFDDFSLFGPAPPSLIASGAVPEPSSIIGLALGAVLVGLKVRRSK